MLEGNPELANVNRIFVGEVDLMLDDVCPTEVELAFADDVVVSVEQLAVDGRPVAWGLDVEGFIEEGAFLRARRLKLSSRWFLRLAVGVVEDFRYGIFGQFLALCTLVRADNKERCDSNSYS